MTRYLLLLGFLVFLVAPSLHAQVIGSDPSNNTICSADISGNDCMGSGSGGTSSGGSYTTICRASSDPSTYCFTPTYDRYGRPTQLCTRGYVGTGYCSCYKGSMTGSCGIQR
jgi:hypothetical protein